MIAGLLSALAAFLAVSVEMIEALAIVVAVGVSRRWSDALIGAVAAVLACGVLAAAVGAGVLSRVPIDSLRLTIGTLLLLFGLEWLRKGTLRLAGIRARSSAQDEFDETVEELEEDPQPASGADWTARAIAFKGVLLEGVEIVLIVSVIASQPGRAAPALVGAGAAAFATVASGFLLRRHLADLPETEVKWAVGVLLTSFGVFFAGEGLHVEWPAGELALLYIAAAMALTSRVLIERAGRVAVP